METDPPENPPSATDEGLTAEEALVVSCVDGQRTLREIAEMSGIDEWRAQAIVDDLARRGVLGAPLEHDEMPAAAPEPSAPPDDPVADEPTGAHEEPDAEAADPIADAKDAADDANAGDPVDEANYRKTFESQFRGLPPDQRVALASSATGGDLCALCLDPDPKVIAAVLTNATFGLPHARLIALHHRNAAGLDHVAGRSDLVRDGLVLRRLVRNPQLGAATLRRIMQSRRLTEIYKAALDRDVPEVSRVGLRGLLRTKFASQAQPEERADLIASTEARVLQQLSGCTFDARTTQILCGRQVYSALFIQNVARFGASPPALLAHLAKLPFVRRNPGLKRALLQHPNMPGDVKRSMA